jgi:hypothetical protein
MTYDKLKLFIKDALDTDCTSVNVEASKDIMDNIPDLCNNYPTILFFKDGVSGALRVFIHLRR